MSEAQIGWKVLQCDCGSKQFAMLFEIRWKDGGGTTTNPSGFKCSQCDTVLDAQYLVNRARIREKREELARMAEELGDDEALSANKEV